MISVDILCEDGPLLAVNKPAGLPTQGVPVALPSLESAVKAYLKDKYQKPGNVYLGIPHRLDRPVSGVVIFARNSKAAARLAEQFRLREVRKWYLAVTEGCPDSTAGMLSDWLLKEPELAQMNVVPAETPGAKLATLSYRLLERKGDRSLLLIELHTGRMHQIRIQAASRGLRILGDTTYGGPEFFDIDDESDDEGELASMALHALRLEIRHPQTAKQLAFTADPPGTWENLPRHLFSAMEACVERSRSENNVAWSAL